MISICVFGSVARKNCDDLSDRDVLVVAPTVAEAEASGEEWRKEGWSLSPFARHQMQSMSERGALFIQHLKLEGVIVRDADSFLGTLFSQYRPKTDYLVEMQDSIWLLQFLRAKRSSGWTSLCGADIAFVSARNIGISLLAARGIFEFAFANVLQSLHRLAVVTDDDLRAISDLRRLKFCYRNRIPCLNSEEVFRKGLDAALRLTGDPGSGISEREPSLRDGYRWLRWLEFNLVSTFGVTHMDGLAESDDLSPVWRLIKDPRHYPDRPRKYDEQWMLAARHAFHMRLRGSKPQISV